MSKPTTRREQLHEIIFEAETPEGKAFDVALLWAILASVLVVALESVVQLREEYGTVFSVLEWTFTVLFTIEYVLRIYSVKRPIGYIFSFYGVIDLLAIIPTYASLYFTGAQSLIVIRAIRLLRVFRVLKLGRYLGEANTLLGALMASRHKIIVFLASVLSLALIMGTIMYLIEGESSGFTSIPRGMYWAIVTMTTVGYGDIAPATVAGQFMASIVMLLGYSILAVPTGIVSAELVTAKTNKKLNTICCPGCSREGHDEKAKFCRFCGTKL